MISTINVAEMKHCLVVDSRIIYGTSQLNYFVVDSNQQTKMIGSKSQPDNHSSPGIARFNNTLLVSRPSSTLWQVDFHTQEVKLTQQYISKKLGSLNFGRLYVIDDCMLSVSESHIVLINLLTNKVVRHFDN